MIADKPEIRVACAMEAKCLTSDSETIRANMIADKSQIRVASAEYVKCIECELNSWCVSHNAHMSENLKTKTDVVLGQEKSSKVDVIDLINGEEMNYVKIQSNCQNPLKELNAE